MLPGRTSLGTDTFASFPIRTVLSRDLEAGPLQGGPSGDGALQARRTVIASEDRV